MKNGVEWGCMLHTLVSYQSTRFGRYASCAALSSSVNDPLRSNGDRSTFQQNRAHCRVRRRFRLCWSIIGCLYSYGEHSRRVSTRGFTNPSHCGPRTKIWTCSALTGPHLKPSSRYQFCVPNLPMWYKRTRACVPIMISLATRPLCHVPCRHFFLLNTVTSLESVLGHTPLATALHTV